MSADPLSATPAGSAAAELDRVLTRLATLGPARLSRPAAPRVGPIGAAAPASLPPDGTPPTPAALVRPLLQHLADVTADAEGRRRRAVPVLADHGVADQLAVLARDVLGLATGAQPDAGDLAARLLALRRALP